MKSRRKIAGITLGFVVLWRGFIGIGRNLDDSTLGIMEFTLGKIKSKLGIAEVWRGIINSRLGIVEMWRGFYKSGRNPGDSRLGFNKITRGFVEV